MSCSTQEYDPIWGIGKSLKLAIALLWAQAAYFLLDAYTLTLTQPDPLQWPLYTKPIAKIWISLVVFFFWYRLPNLNDVTRRRIHWLESSLLMALMAYFPLINDSITSTPWGRGPENGKVAFVISIYMMLASFVALQIAKYITLPDRVPRLKEFGHEPITFSVISVFVTLPVTFAAFASVTWYSLTTGWRTPVQTWMHSGALLGTTCLALGLMAHHKKQWDSFVLHHEQIYTTPSQLSQRQRLNHWITLLIFDAGLRFPFVIKTTSVTTDQVDHAYRGQQRELPYVVPDPSVMLRAKLALTLLHKTMSPAWLVIFASLCLGFENCGFRR